MNENKTQCINLWDSTKAVLRGKYVYHQMLRVQDAIRIQILLSSTYDLSLFFTQIIAKPLIDFLASTLAHQSILKAAAKAINLNPMSDHVTPNPTLAIHFSQCKHGRLYEANLTLCVLAPLAL